MAADRFTIGEMFQTQGYHTSMVGKWHNGMQFFSPNGTPVDLGNNNNVLGTNINATSDDLIDFSIPLTNTPTTNGFDYFFGTSASLDMPPYAWIENETLLFRGGIVTGNGVDFSQARPATNADLLEGQPVDAVNGVRAGAYDPTFIVSDYLEIQAAKVSDIIEERSAVNDPFFIYVPFPAPHRPWSVAQDFNGSAGYLYGDYIAQTDHFTGVILDTLEQSGLAENTIVVMSSDNGPELSGARETLNVGRDSNGPFRGVKRDNWEGGTRVPFTIRWPGRVEPGSVSAQAVSQVDLLATLSEVLGRELDSGEAPDSESFLAVLDGFDKPQARRSGFIQHSVDGQFALVDQDGVWKLIDGTGGAGNRNRTTTYDADNQIIENPDGVIRGNPQQLFDLVFDIGERNNLLLSPDVDALSKQAELNATLDDIRGNTTNGADGDSNVPSFDLDGDGISNYFEDAFPELNANNAGDAQNDDDQDGLNNLAEFAALTDPGDADTDNDGASDGVEVTRGTDPRIPGTEPEPPLPPQETLQCSATSNIAAGGNATQSSNWRGNRFTANNAIDGILTNFTHTERGQSPASWQLALNEDGLIEQIVLHNRDGNTATRLRDLTVTIFDSSNNTVYQSALINPENVLNSPEFITLDLPQAVPGRVIQVMRTPDPDLSGGRGNVDEPVVLSLGEVLINGCALGDVVSPPEPQPEPQPTVNLALNQPATQSSTDFSGAASRAVDGNTNGSYGARSVTHTEVNSQNPWWRVDLGATYNVDHINVFNRTNNCCTFRLDGATVYLGNVNSTDPADYSVIGTLTDSASIQTLAADNTAGRYVMVRIAGQGTLSLAEVEVFGVQQTAGLFAPE